MDTACWHNKTIIIADHVDLNTLPLRFSICFLRLFKTPSILILQTSLRGRLQSMTNCSLIFGHRCKQFFSVSASLSHSQGTDLVQLCQAVHSAGLLGCQCSARRAARQAGHKKGF